MGLKINNYEVKDYGITLDTAYAQLVSVNIGLDGMAHCIFEIQKDRESISVSNPFEQKYFTCCVDKKLPAFEQVYNNAKIKMFEGWEDDIVE